MPLWAIVKSNWGRSPARFLWPIQRKIKYRFNYFHKCVFTLLINFGYSLWWIWSFLYMIASIKFPLVIIAFFIILDSTTWWSFAAGLGWRWKGRRTRISIIGTLCKLVSNCNCLGFVLGLLECFPEAFILLHKHIIVNLQNSKNKLATMMMLIIYSN